MERVLNKGNHSDWAEIIQFYGSDNLVHALKEEINYLTDMTVGAVCEYFQLSKTELKCYTKKQLNQGHWI